MWTHVYISVKDFTGISPSLYTMPIPGLLCHLSAYKGKIPVVPLAFWTMRPIPGECKVIWVAMWAARRCEAAGRSCGNSLVGQQVSKLCLMLSGGPVTQRNAGLGANTRPSRLRPKTAEYLRGLYLYLQRLLAEQFAQYSVSQSTEFNVFATFFENETQGEQQGRALWLDLINRISDVLTYSSQQLRKPI